MPSLAQSELDTEGNCKTNSTQNKEKTKIKTKKKI